MGWQRGLKTSVVTIDFAQFFPSLNHDVLLGVFHWMGFPAHLIRFFESYLVDRCIRYSHERDLSSPMKADIGVGQDSALSPILSFLYLAPLLFRFDSLPGKAVLLSYVDDAIILVQFKTWDDNLHKLTNAY